MEPLRDGWGRELKSLRVSVTDKCNFRCRYCMPAEGLEWLGREEVLTFEEIARLVRVLARMGVDEIRLTGGEPLVRRDLPVLVELLAATPGVRDLSLTTNGVLLDRFAGPLVAAGLRRLNVSLDSLSHVRFAEITRRDALDRVLAGLEAAERHPELRPIKVNCVAIRGFTELEVGAVAARGAAGQTVFDRAPLPVCRRRRRDRLRQPGVRAVLLDLRPNPADGGWTAPNLPVLAPRVGPEDPIARRLLGRAARRVDPLRRRPQGAQAQDQRCGLRQGITVDEPNRRLRAFSPRKALSAGNFVRAAGLSKIDGLR